MDEFDEAILEQDCLTELAEAIPLVAKLLEPIGVRITDNVDISPYKPHLTMKLVFDWKILHGYILQSRKQAPGNDQAGK
jgi:hypothetical protein